MKHYLLNLHYLLNSTSACKEDSWDFGETEFSA